MKKITAILGIPAALCFIGLIVLPQIHYSMSPEKFATDFLGGVPEEKLEDLEFWFHGSHTGYTAAARIKASPSVLSDILSSVGAKASSGGEFPDLRDVPGELKDSWFDLTDRTPVTLFKSNGKNGYTSSFEHAWCLNSDKGILYLIGWGI